MHPKRAVNLINRSNYNGSVASLTVVNLLSPGTEVDNRVLLGNEGLIKYSRHRCGGVHNRRVTVVCRSTLDSLGPSVLVGARVGRLAGHNNAHDTRRLLRLINLSPGHALRSCPRRLSNNRHRHILVTVTLAHSPGLVVTSRPAATLSIAIRGRIVSLLGSLHGGLNFTVIFISRSLTLITGITRSVAIVCTKRIIRRNSAGRVLASPHRRCAHNLLNTIASVRTNTPHLRRIPNAIPDPVSFPGNSHFTPHSSRPSINLSAEPIVIHIPNA